MRQPTPSRERCDGSRNHGSDGPSDTGRSRAIHTLRKPNTLGRYGDGKAQRMNVTCPTQMVSGTIRRQNNKKRKEIFGGGAPGRSRACGLCLRRAALYPAELRVRDGFYSARRPAAANWRVTNANGLL